VATPPIVTAVGLDRVPVPVVTLKLIVSPSTALPFRSVTTARIVLVPVPSADKLLGLAVTATLLTEPAIKLTVVESFTPPEVAVIVAVPRFVGLVSVTVATPFVVVAVAAERPPAVVAKLTDVPSGILFPLVSIIMAVMSVEEAPSATMLELPAVTLTEPIRAVMSVIVSAAEVPFVDVAVTVSVPPAGTVFGAV